MYINETPFDGNIKTALRRSYHKTIQKVTILSALILIIFASLLLTTKYTTISYVLYGIAFLVPIYLHLILPAVILRKNKPNAENEAMFTKGLVQTYTFTKEHIVVTSSDPLSRKEGIIISYAEIVRVTEVKGYVVFNLVSNIAHALSAAGMKQGTINDIYTLLQNAVKANITVTK